MATSPRCSAAVSGILSLACSTVPAAARPAHDPGDGVARAAEAGRLDLEQVFELSSKLTLGSDSFSAWLPAGQGYLATQNGALVRVDAESGQSETHFDPAQAEQAFAALPEIGAERAAELAGAARKALALSGRYAALVNACGDLFHYNLGEARAVRLTHDPLEEVGESLSPDGRLAAYISDWDLHVVPTAGGTPRPLTTAGDENHLYGRLDWVYQEELYGRGNFQGFWWSPDSRRIACLILDESEVPEYTIPDHRKTRPEVEVWRYPKAGDPNPRATLAVLDVAGGAPCAVDLSRYATQEFLIVRCAWTPDGGQVIVQVQDRIQTWLDVVAADPKTGETRVLFRERTPTWVIPTDGPFWIEVERDGTRETQFLWLSERDGWSHLYRYDLAGTLVDRLTEGRWEVDAYHGYDAERGVVYFSGDRADVKGQQLFRVGLDGAGLEQITEEPGTHTVALAPDFAHFADTFSSHVTPTRRTLNRIDGSALRTLEQVDPEPFAAAGIAPVEFYRVPTRDGFEMNAMLIKPAGFDPARRYPVLCHTYGGPGAPQVKDAWLNFNGLFHQMLAQEGYLIWTCDNRSASGMGLESSAGVYKDLGPLELADLEDGVAWLVDQGYADPERVGLWGWSYGGFLTAFALTHSEVFKAGIVGAPVTDWRLYDTIYTERYMDTPQANPEGYARTSVVAAAEALHGKALIIHGVIDENVHMQNSLQLAQALQEAGHLFELMLYPGNRHGIVAPKQKQHLYATMADFIRREL